jgi:hypothetical protein
MTRLLYFTFELSKGRNRDIRLDSVWGSRKEYLAERLEKGGERRILKTPESGSTCMDPFSVILFPLKIKSKI